ncbi:hypothetical protein [Polyangium jinanense]|uniref:Uncharacterized protein n=1 Tax=Polyangium jinanense TaxID=2829994 RepID=A0A9X3X3J5_9BACT|nr:hypothetical protein [Polyangium jinanense]MDC3958036.1 hypothetical protein [Polyangium jinanense]MDC3983589.1 hypothetical protein [Polyangium jinanense]
MRNVLFIAATWSIVALGGCLLSYKSGEYDGLVGDGRDGGAASGGMGGTGGTGGLGGLGGSGGADACHPALCDATSTCSSNPGCPSLAWSARWGAGNQQRVHAIASNGTQIALAGEYNGESFQIGEGSPRTLGLESPNTGYEAYVTLLDGNGVATWAAPVALGIGYQPRTARAVAFAGSDIVVAGSRASAEGGDPDIDVFVRKFTPGDNNGILEQATFQFGGDGRDEAVAVVTDSTGAFYVAGTMTASSSKPVICGMLTHTPKNGMFVAGYDPTGSCMWFFQAGVEGNVQPTALALDEKLGLRVVGHFEGTLTLANDNVLTAESGRTDSFVAGIDMFNGSLTTATQIKAEPGGAVRVTAAAMGSLDGTVYIAGQLEGKTSVEPALLGDKETAAFVMALRTGSSWRQVFTGGNPLVFEKAAGTSLTLVSDSLLFGGLFSGVIDIDPLSSSGTFERAGANPFLAKLATIDGSLSWFDIYDGKEQTHLPASFHVTALQNEVVLAGNWITWFDFSKDGSKTLLPKGDGVSDDDIIAAKITPEP